MGALRVHIPDEGRPTLLLGRFSRRPRQRDPTWRGDTTTSFIQPMSKSTLGLLRPNQRRSRCLSIFHCGVDLPPCRRV